LARYKKLVNYRPSGFGGGNYRSGYLGKMRDYMAPYRAPSKPPDDYDRKLRRELEKIDTSGLSGRFDSENEYNINRSQKVERFSKKEIDELTEKLLDRALDEFKKITGMSELSQENYEVAQDTAKEIAERFEKSKNDSGDSTTVIDFVQDMLSRKSDERLESPGAQDPIDGIRNQMESLKQETLDFRLDTMPEMERIAKEIRESYDMLNSGIPAETTPRDVPLERDTMDYHTASLPSSYDALSNARKRTFPGYESDYDAV